MHPFARRIDGEFRFASLINTRGLGGGVSWDSCFPIFFLKPVLAHRIKWMEKYILRL